MIQSWTNHERASWRRDRGGRRHTTGQRWRYRPRVELLEDRRLLSAGAIDPTFGQNGVTAPDGGAASRALVVEADGKILLLDQTQTGYNLLRYNTDGTPDTTFGDQGAVTGTFGAGTAVFSLGVRADGRIVVAGAADSSLDEAHFNPDGTADTTFANGGMSVSLPMPNITFSDMAVQNSGAVVAVGASGDDLVVVELDASDGQLCPGFGGCGSVTVALGAGAQAGGVAFQSDGKVVVSGFGGGQLSVLRYNADGTPDTTFATAGVATVAVSGTTPLSSHVAVDPTTGQVAATADTYALIASLDGPPPEGGYGKEYFNLFRFNADGSPNTAFGNQGEVVTSTSVWIDAPSNFFSHDVAFEQDGKLLVAQLSEGSTDVLRYGADGALDLTYGNGGDASVGLTWDYTQLPAPTHPLALQGDGEVVVASDTFLNGQDGAYSNGAVVTRLQTDSHLRPQQFGSEAAFREYVIDQAVQRYASLLAQTFPNYYFAFPLATEAVTTSLATGTVDAVDEASPTYSTTNVQVNGVDEGDTVKTDGQYLYVLSGGQLVILTAWPASALQTLSVTALQGSPQAEFLDGDRLTVITQDYVSDPSSPPPGVVTPSAIVAGNLIPYWGYPSQPVVRVTVFDVSDPSAPAVMQQTTLDGTYNTSRAIGDTVYVALSNELTSVPAPTYQLVGNNSVYETEVDYRAQLEALPLNQLLPTYTTHYTDAAGDHDLSGLLTDPADLYQPAVPDDNTLMSLVSFDVSGAVAGPTHSVSLLTSYDATLFAATDNFYLISSRWSYVSNWTFIDQLSLAGGDITLTATGRVPGSILNSYSAGENGNDFYIATTTGWWNNSSNNLYVLTANGASLDVVGKLEGLAPDDSIYAVRFLGDRAFVSTYENTDPLFAVDLSDPTHPVVAGTLEVSGYTGYLQALDATHLIGIGRDSDPVTGETTDITVSLFDVSDLNNPILVSRYHVAPQGWSWSAAEYDFHAITWYPELQALALPISTITEVTAPDGTGSQWVTETGLLVFHVDVSAGTLDLTGEVTDGSEISRGVFIGNVLYSISNTTVQAQSLDDLSTVVSQVQLPAPVNPYPYGWGYLPILVPIDVVLPLVISDDSGVERFAITAGGEVSSPDNNSGDDTKTVVPSGSSSTTGTTPETPEVKPAAPVTDTVTVSVTTPVVAQASSPAAVTVTLTTPAPAPLSPAGFLAPASQAVTSTSSSAQVAPVTVTTTAAVAVTAVDTGSPSPLTKPHISAGGQEPPPAPLDAEDADFFREQEGEAAPQPVDAVGGPEADAALCAVWASVWRAELSHPTAALYRELGEALADPPQTVHEGDAGREAQDVSPLWALAVAALLPIHQVNAGRRERRTGWLDRS